ncbi:hypothetical protein SAMN05421748_113107 [Paractinoplanes atraurantiacus]|uniref:Uncharacterized protein n=2 Tax=Paractinoplanes atraurantiacus TaxID=1036182 RepID=A0A285IXQ2_9ACTN|nr:hypothetical protein SAMN05421748_113107 [Actinoplanes atraurantiacus]
MRAHPFLAGLGGGYVGAVFALKMAALLSGSYDLQLALWFACAPLSIVSGPYELVVVRIVSDLLGDAVAVVTDVLWWVMLASVQTLTLWGVCALLQRCQVGRRERDQSQRSIMAWARETSVGVKAGLWRVK